MTPRKLDVATARKMGRKGSRTRAKNLSPARRKQIASTAALARWPADQPIEKAPVNFGRIKGAIFMELKKASPAVILRSDLPTAEIICGLLEMQRASGLAPGFRRTLDQLLGKYSVRLGPDGKLWPRQKGRQRIQ